ncbi:MAG: radical SAM protein [Nitrososphaerales archaeon]|nr:radical SAM protein [Nitrososphaerales archaeon]
MATIFRNIRTPDGLLLFERKTGVNILLDEMKGRWKWEKPLYVAVQVTNVCNRQCRWCYASSSSSAPSGVWTREKLLNLCHYLDRWGVLGVAFGGGETFTFPGFATLATQVWDSTGLDVGATSNGDLITHEDLATMRGHFGHLRISVWHPSEFRSKVIRLLGQGVDIGINTILFKGGVGLVKSIVEEGVKAGVNDFLILACKVYGGAVDSMAPDAEDVRNLAEYIRKHQEIGFKVDPALSVALAAQQTRFLQPWIEEKSGPRFLSITYDGYVKPDSFSDARVLLMNYDQLPEIHHGFFGSSLHV